MKDLREKCSWEADKEERGKRPQSKRWAVKGVTAGGGHQNRRSRKTRQFFEQALAAVKKEVHDPGVPVSEHAGVYKRQPAGEEVLGVVGGAGLL